MSWQVPVVFISGGVCDSGAGTGSRLYDKTSSRQHCARRIAVRQSLRSAMLRELPRAFSAVTMAVFSSCTLRISSFGGLWPFVRIGAGSGAPCGHRNPHLLRAPPGARPWGTSQYCSFRHVIDERFVNQARPFGTDHPGRSCARSRFFYICVTRCRRRTGCGACMGELRSPRRHPAGWGDLLRFTSVWRGRLCDSSHAAAPNPRAPPVAGRRSSTRSTRP